MQPPGGAPARYSERLTFEQAIRRIKATREITSGGWLTKRCPLVVGGGRVVIIQMQVTLRQGETFDSLLKRFRSSVAKHGIISDYKRHQSFVSKSQKLRAKIQRAQRKRMLKAARRAS